MRHILTAALGVASLAACGPAETDRATEAACAIAVNKALPLLAESVKVDVAKIESGKSGDALSCKVTGAQEHLMIDATVTCSGGADALMECTTIDSIQTVAGDVLYP
ncbi:MAG: hypothetical protein WA989_15230 [Henriciella sp.]|uniref:hypothetical protein n=1 Tax=Henriciella sp. TaxID=1968823 RepID=UPI003C77A7F7